MLILGRRIFATLKARGFCYVRDKAVYALRERRLHYSRRLSANWEKFIESKYFDQAESHRVSEKKLYVWWPVWGKDYISYLFDYCIPSMLQDGNLPALQRDGFQINMYAYTKESEYRYILAKYGENIKYLNEQGFQFNLVPFHGYEDVFRTRTCADMAIHIMEKCLRDNALLFNGGVDHIYGNYTILNAVKLVFGKNVCLAIPHACAARESTLQSPYIQRMRMMERSIDNEELAFIAYEFMHETQKNAFDHVDENSTYGGVSFRMGRTESELYVVHNIPSVAVAYINRSDIRLFRRTREFGIWDKRWMRLLCKENRLKVLGSSQIGFFIEHESADRKSVKKVKGLRNFDKYTLERKNRLLNNYTCNSFYLYWQMKKPVD